MRAHLNARKIFVPLEIHLTQNPPGVKYPIYSQKILPYSAVFAVTDYEWRVNMFYSDLKSTTRIQWAAPAAEYKPFRSLVARSIIAPEGRISSCDLTNKTPGCTRYEPGGPSLVAENDGLKVVA